MRRARRRELRQLHRAEDGAATVEFTIVFFFLLLPLFVGIAEFGRALWQHQAVTKGVRDATRYLTRVEDPNDAGAQSRASSLAAYGTLTGGALPEGWSIDITTSSPGGDFRREPLIVTVTASVALDLWMLPAVGLDPGITLTIRDQARHYGE